MLRAIDAIQRTLEARALGTVVYVGAGRGAELDAILRRSPRRLIVLEGDGGRATALRRRFARRAEVEVHAGVVSPEGGQRTWHRYNLRRLDGLLPADERLTEAYPRLDEIGSALVDTMAMGPWLEGLAPGLLKEDDNNLLVFDVAGTEGPLLQSLAARHLDAFAWVTVRGAAEPLHDGGSALAEVRGRLQQMGYRVVDSDREEALWPVELYHGDPRLRRLHRTQRRLETVTAALEARSADLNQAQAHAKELQLRSGELASQIAAQEQALAAARQRSEALVAETDRLKRDGAALRAAQEQAGKAHAQQLAKVTSRVEQVSRELAQARTTTAQCVKLQMLRESDLRELRDRYEALRRQERTRQELLSRLGQRLSVAQQHFARMAEAAGAPPAVEVDGDDARGLP